MITIAAIAAAGMMLTLPFYTASDENAFNPAEPYIVYGFPALVLTAPRGWPRTLGAVVLLVCGLITITVSISFTLFGSMDRGIPDPLVPAIGVGFLALGIYLLWRRHRDRAGTSPLLTPPRR